MVQRRRDPVPVEEPTPDPDATIQVVDTLGHAIDGAADWDVLEERRALAEIEARLFARARDPVLLSRYLLLRPLGSGATGVVYDGYDPELARRVAIKVLRTGRGDRESVARARARFAREAQSIARLSHPHVIAVYDVGTYSPQTLAPAALEELAQGQARDAGVFIVMELCEGHDLGTWLERRDRSWREIVRVFLAAGEGLAAAHAAGIVHRDFKPGNVLVGDDGAVKVVDFGLAQSHGGTGVGSRSGASASRTDDEPEAPAVDRLTRTGAVLGTPAYMAPEQHRGEVADQKADQFAFCASLYRALYGHPAFAGGDVEALRRSKSAGEVQPLPEDARVPAWVHRAVLRGLQADPARRFASMDALLAALRADPVLRWRRWARRAAVPVGLAALGYAGWLATRPGQVVVSAQAKGRAVPGVVVHVGERELVGGEGEVPAGLHRVRVTAPDHEPAQTVIDVRRGGVHEVAVELRHEQGMFELELEPTGGHVLVDGVDYGSRLRATAVDTGPHELLLRHEGYEDQRLQWTARAGETERGFVALRKALAWSRPASGSGLEAAWLGDANGDGLDELVQRRFTRLTAYDPWNDRELWRVVLAVGARYRLCDTDGDGVREVVALEQGETEAALVVYDGASRERRPAPRARIASAWGAGQGPLGLGEVVCVPTTDGTGATLVVAGLRAGEVVALRGRDGTERWSVALGDEPVSAVALRGGPKAEDTVAEDTVAVVGLQSVHALTLEGTVRWSKALTVAARSSTPDDPQGVEAGWLAAVSRAQERAHGWVSAASLDDVPGDDLLLHVSGDSADATGQGEGDGMPWTLVALAGADGVERWRHPVDELVPIAPEALADVDGDGSMDLLVPRTHEPGALALWSGRSGRALWTRPRAADHRTAWLLKTRPQPRVATVQTEGERAELTVLDAATGRIFARAPLPQRSRSPVTVVDWNGDGHDDLVLGTDDGVLRAFGTQRTGWDEARRFFDPELVPLGTVPLRIPVTAIDASRDANHDGFVDLLLEARGPAVVVGPKVRWDRRPLDAVRATPVVAALTGPEGGPRLALFGQLDEAQRLDLLDARTGALLASSRPSDTPNVIRPPALLPTAVGYDLVVVGSDAVWRFRGSDAALVRRLEVGHAYASPTVADVDGDGHPEVVVVTWEDPGRVYVLDAATFAVRWQAELGKDGSFGAPYVGDVDGDGAAEVVVASLDGRVICLSAQGELRWATPTGGRLNFEPTVADLDGDGTQEILVTPHLESDPLVVLQGADGHERARWPGVATRRARPEVLDVDGDGRPEVFSSTATRGIVSLHGDGRVRWQYAFVDVDGLQPPAAGSPVLADLDGDGMAEVVAGFEDGSLHVVDAREGVLRWRFQTGREEIEASPAVADVDGDGRAEVFVAGHDRHLFCLEHGPGRAR